MGVLILNEIPVRETQTEALGKPECIFDGADIWRES